LALLDEQLVEEWLNQKGFFTIRGIKSGLGEIDLLAVKPNVEPMECWHVEVQISFRPIGYIGGNTNAKARSDEEIRAGVVQWIDKKFNDPRKDEARQRLVPKARWRRFLVHGAVREKAELTHMAELGVELLPYYQVLQELRDQKITHSSSMASSIAEILRYVTASPAVHPLTPPPTPPLSPSLPKSPSSNQSSSSR
jgi:Holliday junction resolvase-like predicted endonuclease